LFEITLAPNEEPIWLRITGPSGARELLAAQLPGFSTARRPASTQDSS